MLKIGINGFGRIGRTIYRKSLEDSRLQVVHINDLTQPATLAHLLKYDSVHGTLPQSISCDDDSIKIANNRVSVSSIRSPEDIPWRDKKVDIVFECTGLFTDKNSCEKHIVAGAKKVLISAPAKNADITVVYGVNHEMIRSEHKIISNGSCTTNSLAPLCKIIHDNFKIKSGMMTTIHSYTGDQRILDFPHKDLRRARAGTINMIPTSTGAARAIGEVIPELNGLIDGYAVRVPTPNVSLVDLTLQVDKKATLEGVKHKLTEAANTYLSGVLACVAEPLVSSDFNGSKYSSIVDLEMTKVIQDHMLKIVAWYDNETGFSSRMLDVAAFLQNIK